MYHASNFEYVYTVHVKLIYFILLTIKYHHVPVQTIYSSPTGALIFTLPQCCYKQLYHISI